MSGMQSGLENEFKKVFKSLTMKESERRKEEQEEQRKTLEIEKKAKAKLDAQRILDQMRESRLQNFRPNYGIDIFDHNHADDKIDKFTFNDVVPPGFHYFYFVKDGKYFCLSDNYQIAEYPATNLRMNKIEIIPKEWLCSESKHRAH